MRFKKIMSIVGGAALLLGATFAGAVVADTLTGGSLRPWTQTNIVYGQNAASSDTVGAIDIQNSLINQSTAQINMSINQTIVAGEAKAIETSSQPLYFGDFMNDTKTTFTKDQLPVVLADGRITDSDGKDYDYNQKINIPNSKVIYGESPDNLDPPIIYADFNSQSIKYDLRIIFPTAVDFTKLTDEQITLFGKNYVFSGNSADLSNSEILLFEKSKAIKVIDGTDVTEGNHTYSVSVEDATHAVIYVDGESKSVKEGFSGKVHGIDLYVKDIFGPDYLSSGQSRYVELYVNANSLSLQDGQEVSLANDDIVGTKVQFINSSNKVSEIKISVSPYQLDNDTKYVKEGNSFIDPVFGSMKFALQGVTPTLDNSTRDYIEIKASREDRLGLDFINRLGKEYNLDVLVPSPVRLDSSYLPMFNETCTTAVNTSHTYTIQNTSVEVDPITGLHNPLTYDVTNYTMDCTVPGTWTYNGTMLGIGDNKNLVVQTNKNISEGDYFVTTSGEYSQIWKLDSIHSDGKVNIKDVSGGDTIVLSIGTVGSTGSLNLADGSAATIKLNSGSITLLDKAANYLYTEKGAKIILPLDNSSGIIQLIEETSYNGGDFHSVNGGLLGTNSLNLTWLYKSGRSGKDIFLKGVNYGTKDTDYWSGTVGDNDVYSVTKYGTFIKQTGSDDKKLAIYYPENAVQAKFYIGELNAIQDVSTTTQSYSIITNKDTESVSYQNNNIVVVGGSCINAVAAKLLGSDSPICENDFTLKTGVGAGQYLVEVFKNPWNTDKVAILVAGYNAEDTTRGVNDLLTIPMNLSVGSKIIG